MEPSVNDAAFAARKTGEVCTSVLSGTTAKKKDIIEYTVICWRVRRHTAIMIWIS